MSESVVVVLGGYGSFGRLVAASLCRHEGIRVIVAGRDRLRAARLCDSLGAAALPAELDVAASDLSARLSALSPSVVIDTVGPFQFRDDATARACLDAGAHYLDLADSREYVTNIERLNAVCLQRGLLAASGASTCPALTTAVADRLCHDLETIETLAIGVAPGHRVPRGLATTRAVLSYCGKSIPALRDGGAGRTFGWSGLIQHRYGAPIGRRWLSRVDLPELALWPRRYRNLQRIEARAGLEITVLHLGLTFLSALVRPGFIDSLAPHAERLLRISDAFERWGTPVGAMHVQAVGHKSSGERIRRTWSILAQRGDGPRIPATPSALLAKRLLGVTGYAPLAKRGALPCAGLLSLEEILAELEPFAIRTDFEEKPLAL